MTYASIVSNKQNESVIKSFAKEVANSQQKLTVDREEREKNIMIFNVPEDKDKLNADMEFFKSMCSETLEYENVPKVEIARPKFKPNNHHRPIKVCFDQSWDKRKFLSSLWKLKTDKKFDNIRISHDMNEEDRRENKKLLKEAYQKNVEEKNTEFKYKVRGPPWAMKIVKVFTKN